jgi:hypothetical protein
VAGVILPLVLVPYLPLKADKLALVYHSNPEVGVELAAEALLITISLPEATAPDRAIASSRLCRFWRLARGLGGP